MKIIRKSADILIVKTETILSFSLGAGGLFFLCLAVYSFIVHAGTIQDRIYFGQAGAAVTLIVMALFCFEKSVFVFDRRQRRLTWKIRTVFTNLSGTLGFVAIKSIKVQSLRDSENSKSVRVAIIGYAEEVPLTKSYSGNTEEVRKIAETLDQWVFEKEHDFKNDGFNNSFADVKELHDFDIDSGDKELLLSITAIIMFVGGPLFLILGLYGFFKSIATTNWHQTNAVVVSSGLRAESEDDEYRFEIEYRYKVDGVDYHSNTLYMKAIMNKKKAYSIINKFYLKDDEVINPRDFPPGKVITIYYDPENHKSAVVIPGVGGGIWAMMIMGGVFLLIYLYLGRRDLRNRALKESKKQKGS